ncbi:aminotransferase class I/II-fold pyridoxal phosphate-dependent enzyme [Alicyclobacillus ferrooxydans]|uniref:aminotransferase class I/II-fold pyridoxal phosphate-dependent enzyme n=1 Tax=Alicyclobacillus ferrooxydans TaxID=471514 RepID=UPI000A9F7CBC|nr:aminotransferase class I/II-fold pyridoxal phosphate-dependent enzyme [Alicyclobacillus ferrooxydans]
MGAEPVPVPAPLLEAKDFRFDVDHLSTLISNKTKLIILNSPQNPTGGVLTEADLIEVSRLAIEHDLWVLTDEIYSRIIYNGAFHSIASIPGMKERTIILDGFSKTYAMTGWRLGYGVMNRGLADLTARLVTNSNSCTTTFVQYGGISALTGSQDFVHEMVEEFRARRDIVVSALRNMRGVTCREPSGAFYVFPNVTEACRNLGFTTAKELQQHLLHEGVAVLPRTAFGSKNEGEQEEYLRLSYATSRENIRKGLELMKQVLEQ